MLEKSNTKLIKNGTIIYKIITNIAYNVYKIIAKIFNGKNKNVSEYYYIINVYWDFIPFISRLSGYATFKKRMY